MDRVNRDMPRQRTEAVSSDLGAIIWYNSRVTERWMFLFAHTVPCLMNVRFSVTRKMTNIGCGILRGKVIMRMRRKLISSYMRERILREFKHKCVYCTGTATEVEHVEPYSYSKDNSEQNLVAACVYCNSVARDIVFESFEKKKDYILTKRTEKAAKVGRWRGNKIIPFMMNNDIKPFEWADNNRPAWHKKVYGCR